MSVAKVIEISAQSPESFEAAIAEGISRTAKNIDDIQGAWIKGQQVVIESGRITAYRVDMKITFVVHD